MIKKLERGCYVPMRKGEVSLDAYGKRGGFQGKCGVREANGVKILRSYETDYAAECGGKIVLLSDFGWTTTSGTHIAAFAAYCGVDWEGKKSFEKAPTINAEGLTDAQIAAKVKRVATAA